MHMGQRVISADNHIVDPKDLYLDRMPAEFRDQRAARDARSRRWRRLELHRRGADANVRARGGGRPGLGR